MPSASAKRAFKRGTPPRRAAPRSSVASVTRSWRLDGWTAISPWRRSGWAMRASGARRRRMSECRPNGARPRRSASTRPRRPSAPLPSGTSRRCRPSPAGAPAERAPGAAVPPRGGPRGRRQAEAALAQLEARRDALSELDREHVGLAPAAQALLKVRNHFGDGVLGPLADFVRTSRRDAELAERLLGEWLHAVLVRDASVIDAIRAWHAETQPGPIVLLPAVPGPRLAADGYPLKDDLRVDGPAAAWVRALLAGHEVIGAGALRRANGAVFLDSATPAAGPLQRRAELEALEKEVREATTNLDRARATEESTVKELAAAEAALTAAGHGAEQARRGELEAGDEKGEADRVLIHARRQAEVAPAQV